MTSLLTEGEMRAESERLATLNLELTDALARRGQKLLGINARLEELRCAMAEAFPAAYKAAVGDNGPGDCLGHLLATVRRVGADLEQAAERIDGRRM